ncbi:MAG: hypothetical protein LBF68_07520 [Christensenellaceae bacterium]|jgi:hypothetical protein|nr:hypothetical protein [Christensenellaceae bacterium]
MAKKTKSASKSQILQICAFITLILAAIIWILSAFGILGGAAAAMMFIKDLLILFTISLAAHPFAKSLGQTWYIIYWVIVVLAFVGMLCANFNLINI